MVVLGEKQSHIVDERNVRPEPPEKNQVWMVSFAVKMYNTLSLNADPTAPPPPPPKNIK